MGKSRHTAKNTVRDRSENLCEKCGVELTKNVDGEPDALTARSIHHRQPRRRGGRDSVVNLVNLCLGCHRAIHADEKAAARGGWMIEDRYPGKVPYQSWQGWVLPLSDGSKILLDFDLGRAVDLSPAYTQEPRRKRYAYRRRCKRG